MFLEWSVSQINKLNENNTIQFREVLKCLMYIIN